MWTEDQDALEVVRQEFEDWLRGKDYDVVLQPGVLALKDATVQFLTNDAHSGYSARLSLRERSRMGVWHTQVLGVQRPGGGTWIRLSVTNDEQNWVAVPRLARNIVTRLNVKDGRLNFSDQPRIIGERGVEGFLNALTDPDRQGLILAAGTADGDIPFDAFARKMGQWTSQVQGMAQVAVLTPAASEIIGGTLGRLTPRPWTLRTYYPGVDPDSAEDAVRHRYLSTNSLATMSDHQVRRLLGRIARTHAAERALPSELARVRRDFERIASRLVFEVPVPESAPRVEGIEAPLEDPRAPETSVVTPATSTVLAPLLELLGVEALDESAVSSVVQRLRTADESTSRLAKAKIQSDQQQDHIEALEENLQLEVRSRDDAELDAALWKEHADGLQQSLRVLAKTVGQQRDDAPAVGATAESSVFTMDVPSSFAELVGRLPGLAKEGVVFTGKADVAVDLDAQDTLGVACGTGWNALLALVDYIRYRTDDQGSGGVEQYLKHTPPSYFTFPPGKHANTETRATLDRFGAERVFACPTSVDATGRTLMTAHFKLGQIGMVSPRMYYLDHVAAEGKIYVGYIGPHLTNTQTN
jgi:hypothetical protein